MKLTDVLVEHYKANTPNWVQLLLMAWQITIFAHIALNLPGEEVKHGQQAQSGAAKPIGCPVIAGIEGEINAAGLKELGTAMSVAHLGGLVALIQLKVTADK